MESNRKCRRCFGFTLIEVLVTVAIIALLISILLPSLSRVRAQARGSVCLSNLKQVGTGLAMYLSQYRDRYPQHSSPSGQVPRTRWPDYLYRSMISTDVYRCPSLSDEQEQNFLVPFAHTVNRLTGAPTPQTKYHGGYGYNFQYLGNARFFTPRQAWMPADYETPYFAPVKAIRMPALTVALGDTRGSKKGNAANPFGVGGAATYALDPPLGSRDLGSKGSRKSTTALSDWYEGSGVEELVRSAPDRRHLDRPNMAFADGHAERIDGDALDGRRNGGTGDNRYFNGRFDTQLR